MLYAELICGFINNGSFYQKLIHDTKYKFHCDTQILFKMFFHLANI